MSEYKLFKIEDGQLSEISTEDFNCGCPCCEFYVRKVKEARKQAFLEAAKMVGYWENDPESTMVKRLREKANEEV